MKRSASKWHIVDDNGTAGKALLCGPKFGVQHLHASREAFEAMPKRGRCFGCEAALDAYKARLLAEVEEIERRDATKRCA
jgi:hypothetical protein